MSHCFYPSIYFDRKVFSFLILLIHLCFSVLFPPEFPVVRMWSLRFSDCHNRFSIPSSNHVVMQHYKFFFFL